MGTTTDTLLVTDSATFRGSISCPSNAISAQSRDTILLQDPNAVFPIKLTDLRVWDAFQTPLPGTAATDDLALIGGTFGTAHPMVQAGDLKAAGATTRYARFTLVVPECYDEAETFSIVISAGMKTTVADTSCTVDVECYKHDKVGGLGSDICATAAQSINSLTFADKSFTITPASLTAGSVLDVRVTIACNDAATGTAVTPTIANIDAVMDIKG